MHRKETRALPLMTREAPVVGVDGYTIELVWTTGAEVLRYDLFAGREYLEVLSHDPKHVRMGRLQSGKAPILNSHSRNTLDDVLGVVVSATLNGTEGRATAKLSNRPEVAGIVADVKAGIIGNVSVGYRIYEMEMVPPDDSDGLWVYRAIDWEPQEISLVAVPADVGATVKKRSDPFHGQRNADCVFVQATETRHEETDVSILKALAKACRIELDENQGDVREAVAARLALSPTATDEDIVHAAINAAKPDMERARKEGERAARVRVAEILAFSRRHRMPEDMTERAISEGWSQERCADEILDHRASEGDRTAPVPGGGSLYGQASGWDDALAQRYGR